MFYQCFNRRRGSAHRWRKQLILSAGLIIFSVCTWVLLPGKAYAQALPTVLPPDFSVSRGFYSAPFQVTLSTVTAGATIRYTTDGSTPSASNGTTYSGPINIATTTALRAIALKGTDLSPVITHTYIFLGQVRNQPNTPPAGWPSLFAANDGHGPYPADYEMDPEIVNHPNYTNKLTGALLSIPTVSIVTDLPQLWDPSFGIFYNPNAKGSDPNSPPDPLANKWERPISIEWINPDGTAGFGEMGGIKLHGQGTRRPQNTPKHSFQLSFKAQYGITKLNYHLFNFNDPVGKFDALILRDGGNRMWSYYDRDQRRETDYANDEWGRRTWLQMGHLTAQGTYVHLYINGLYWGLYEVTERLDEKFLQSYLGGSASDYDYIVANEDLGNIPSASAGTLDAYNALVSLLSGTAPLSDATYQQVAQQMDMVDFADYMLHTHYIGKTDWPNHNWNAYRKRSGPDTRFHWMTWDDDTGLNRVNQAWDLPNAALDYPQSPSWMFLRLITNAEFRQLFADRIYKHVVAPDGVLTPANCAAIYTDLTNQIDQAVIGESARWGDYSRDVYHLIGAVPDKSWPAYLYSRDLLPTDPINTTGASGAYPDASKKSWTQVRAEKLSTYCPGRGANLIAQYVTGDIHVGSTILHIPLYQTTLVPPSYSQRGGAVPLNYTLVIANPNSSAAGDIYYTTDGADPRVAGGGIAPTALAGGDAVQTPITKVTNVKARIKNGTAWSPLMDYMFYPPQPFTNLVINEIHYHPLAPTGVTSSDHYEFIELYNRGTTTLQLDNVAFTSGFSYHFPVGSTIAPNQYLVLASDVATFSTRYPGVMPFGELRGNLANAGEAIKLVDAVGNLIDSVNYATLTPWPTAPDGTGPSLELLNPAWDNSLATNWRASTVANGTPGAQNSVFLVSLPPTVTLTSPPNNASFQVNTPVTLSATASDSDGTVAQVAFLANGKPIPGCSVTTSPYTCTWTPTTFGVYNLTAQATDNLGVAALSAAVGVTVINQGNQPPVVTLTSPAAGATVLTGNTVQVAAAASDNDGTVAQVAFFVNGMLLPPCVDKLAPYECAWTPTTAGTYQLTAQATDDEGATALSAATTVTVSDTPNQPPTITLTSPLNGATVQTNHVLVIAATADDTDGTVAQVTFLVDGSVIPACVVTAEPYECTWTPPTDRTYQLTAQATDDKGAITVSAPVVIQSQPIVNQPPTVAILRPLNGDNVQTGQAIVIEATASDSDGRVTQVTFFADDTPLPNCVAMTAPYECTWTPTTDNDYQLTAQATDDKGATTRSDVVLITSNSLINQLPTATFTKPANGTSFLVGSPIVLAVKASDSDGVVAQVAFFANGTPIPNCVATTAPYECIWTPTTVGTYTLTAVATDNRSGRGTTPSLLVKIQTELSGQGGNTIYLPFVIRHP